jgi:hypothetical protein
MSIALLLITIPLGASPRMLTPERPLSAPVSRPNAFTYGVRVATNGETTFACWSDPRSGRFNDVFAKRLDRDGNPVGDDIPIVTGNGDNGPPQIVWDGRRFLIVATIWNNGTWIRELRPDGTAGDYKWLFSESDISSASVAALPGGGAVILYRRNAFNATLEMRTIDTVSGAGPPVTLATDPRYVRFPDTPRIVRSGNTLIAVWLYDRTVFAQRIDAQGVRAPFPVAIGTLTGGDLYSQLLIATAPAADGALLAYSFDGKVNVFTISNGGAIAPLTAFTVDLWIDELAVTPDGGFVAAENRYDNGGYWTTQTRLHRFDRDGRFVERTDVAVGRPALLSAPDSVVMLGWSSAFELVSCRYGAPSATPISLIPPLQTQPRFATDGTNVLLCWNEQGKGPLQQTAALFDAQGQLLHPPVAINDVGSNEVEAGFDGRFFYLVHGGFQSISVRRIARDGALREFIPIRRDEYVGHLTAAGSTIAWIRTTGLTWLDLDGAGYPIDTKIETRWVVAGSDGASDLLGIVTSQGEIQVMLPGAAPVPVANGWPQAIAGNGTNWLITYTGPEGFVAELLQHDGSPAGRRFKITEGTVGSARVVWDGEAFVVIWQKNGLYATTIEGDAVVVTEPVASGDVLDFAAVNAGGSVLMAYQRLTPATALTSRIFTRTLFRPRLRAISHQ